MGRGYLSPEEILMLEKNPYVYEVDNKKIMYTNEFKLLFMQEYNSGKKPSQIFAEHGFDLKVLGSKRIERAAARWKESYRAGTLGKRKSSLPSKNETIKSLKEENKILRGLLAKRSCACPLPFYQPGCVKIESPKRIQDENRGRAI